MAEISARELIIKPTSITWECPECELKIEVDVYPFVKGRYQGDPYDCYPDEPPYIEPEECDCGAKINQDYCFRIADGREEYE